MNKIYYRESTPKDITSLARIRSINSGSEEYWQNRVSGYLNGTHHPQQALGPRIIYVAVTDGVDVGNALARRFYSSNGAEDLDENWMIWNDIGKILP